MGEAGIRAVALCDENVIQELNSRYVPVFLDDLYTRDLSRTGPLTHTLKSLYGATYSELQRPHPLVQVFIVKVSGEVVVGPDVMTVASTRTLITLLQEHDGGVVPGPALARYTSASPLSASNSDLQMRVVGRFDTPATGTELALLDPAVNPSFFFDPTFNAPSRDWAVLHRNQWSALLPPADAPVGTPYTIPTEVASAILMHFYSAWSPLVIKPELVRQVSMSGTVEASGRVSLSAHFNLWNPGQRGSSPEDIQSGWVIGDVIGILRYEPGSREITDIQLATTRAAHHTQEGFVMPYSVVAYRVR